MMRTFGLSGLGNEAFRDNCIIDGRSTMTGSGPGPVVDAPAHTSLISQVGSPDPHAVHRYSTRYLISKNKRISLHQEIYGTVQ